MRLRKMQSAAVRGRRVLVRTDYNIETVGQRLADTTRIATTVPTVRWLLDHGAAVIIVSHRGRPKGRQLSLSLRPAARALSRLLKLPVAFWSWPLFSHDVTAAAARLQPGQVVLLENIRFEAGEEENSGRVAKRLASLCDVVVNDAFATVHRAHASVVGLEKLRPAYAGLLMQNEVEHLSPLLGRPRRPFVAILGGAKISTKLGLIRRLLKRADKVLLGGALANTILQAEGVAIGASLTERSMIHAAEGLSTADSRLEIPCDVVVAQQATVSASRATRAVGKIGKRERILDIGPDTIDVYRRAIMSAKTIVWNGPMGLYEVAPFRRGTTAIARAVAKSKATSVVGGGETIDALKRAGVTAKIGFVSTGGGAMLEFLEGKRLPGLAVLEQR